MITCNNHIKYHSSEQILKETATHSSVLAWRIPGTGEPGGLLSMLSHRVRHDWSDLAAAAYLQKVQNYRNPGKHFKNGKHYDIQTLLLMSFATFFP